MTTVDAFCFFNELDLLEVRLRELYPVVDTFVLAEATRTHKGDPKPLWYAEHRQRYAPYNDKIMHVVVGDLPAGDTQAAIWRREIGQRQAIGRALRYFSDDTVVLVSDLDEIPRREAVAMFRGGMPDDMIVTFDQTLYYYNVNTRCDSLRWNGTRATWRANVDALTPDGVRWESLKQRSSEYPRPMRLMDAGWHLSYFGDVQQIQRKMRSFLHQELVNDATLDAAAIARRMATGQDVWGRDDQQQFTVGPAPVLPWAMRCDPARYAHFFHPDWRPVFHEDWYNADQAEKVGALAQQAQQGTPDGAIVEIGCWEGRSTACIAQSVAPQHVVAVDHWRGNATEASHPSVAAASERDVYATFEANMARLAPGTVRTVRADWRDWLGTWTAPIAFLHLDAAHDYESVAGCLRGVLPFLLPGAIVCGDDYYADGVHRAVRDVLGERVQNANGRLWVWQKVT